MIKTFKLKIGETISCELNGSEYKFSCSIFKDHDHKNLPLYYYHDSIKPEDLVASIEELNSQPYPSPYSCEVDSTWSVNRNTASITFTKGINGFVVISDEK